MEPWKVFIRIVAEIWAEEDIRSGKYGKVLADEKNSVTAEELENEQSTKADENRAA